jgi:hypothetical protein
MSYFQFWPYVFVLFFIALSPILSSTTKSQQKRQTCTIQPTKDGSDDSLAILAAFEKCGQGGHVVFLPEVYNIARVMKTVKLNDCQIDIHGMLRVRSSLSMFKSVLYG